MREIPQVLEAVVLLSQLIEPDFVQLALEARTWQEAVTRVFSPMVTRGKVTQTYVEDVISAVNELGPYFVLTKGVALPHGFPERGVLEPAMGICRLKKPVDFGSAPNDPVRYVIPFAARDATAHLEALTALTDLIGDPAFFAAIDNATEPSSLLAFIRCHEGTREE